MDDLQAELSALSGKKLAVICVGNPMRGDDGFGPAVAARLEGPRVFDAGAVPENVVSKAASLSPEAVIFVDAAEFGAPPGTLRLISPQELAQGGFSTHSAPLSVCAEFIKQACGADSVLLAAQAANTKLGSVMSVAIAKAVERAAALLREILR